MDDFFDFDDYRQVLKILLKKAAQGGRGGQTRLAHHLGCQQAFISRVTSGKAELSPEQSYGVSVFFNLNRLEREFWLNLVAETRAGNKELKSYHQEKRERLKEEFRSLNKKIDVGNKLSEAEKLYYYSEWYYVAIHILVGIEGFNTEELIAERLGIAVEVARFALNYLEMAGLISKSGGQYRIGNGGLHLTPDHPLIKKHHINWRLQTMQRLSKPNGKDLHYSAVMSCGQKDKEKVRNILTEAVTKIRETIKSSPDEVLCHYAIDYFEI
jgi:uncharacterized protein (TIGR02147 family)